MVLVRSTELIVKENQSAKLILASGFASSK